MFKQCLRGSVLAKREGKNQKSQLGKMTFLLTGQPLLLVILKAYTGGVEKDLLTLFG